MLSSELVRIVPSQEHKKGKGIKFFSKYGDSKYDKKRSKLRKTLLEDFNKDQKFEPNSFSHLVRFFLIASETRDP